MEARDYVSELVQLGWTQARIAERTGIPQPTISKVLRGDVSDVLSRSYRKLQALHSEVKGVQAQPAAAQPAEIRDAA